MNRLIRALILPVFLLGAAFVHGPALASPETASVQVTSAVGEVEIEGSKIQVLEIRFLENEAREELFTAEDLDRSKKAYLQKRKPQIFDAEGQAAPVKYLGREIKQTATDNRLSRWIVFKYKPKNGSRWDWAQPLKVRFEGEDYSVSPAAA